MIVSMWMKRDLATVLPATPVAEAAALMAQRHVRRLLVVRHQAGELRLLGIVSARDVLHAFPPEVNPFAVEAEAARRSAVLISDIMKTEVLTTTPDTPIEQAAALMEAAKVGALPVLREKDLVGIITESDIFRAFVGLFAAQGGGARITFDASKGEDVFALVARLAQRHRVHVRTLVAGEQDGQPVFIVRVEGVSVQGFLDELWTSGHLVINVVHFPAA